MDTTHVAMDTTHVSMDTSNVTWASNALHGQVVSLVNTLYYLVLIPIGLLGNFFTIIVVSLIIRHQPTRRSIPDLCVGVLASVDFFSVAFVHSVTVGAMATDRWPYPSWVCQYQAFASITYLKLEFILQVTMSADRYLAVVRPLRYHQLSSLRSMRTVLMVIVLLSLTTSIFAAVTSTGEVQLLGLWNMCMHEWTLDGWADHADLAINGVIYVLGLAAFVFCNGSLVRILWQYHAKRADSIFKEISEAVRAMNTAKNSPSPSKAPVRGATINQAARQDAKVPIERPMDHSEKPVERDGIDCQREIMTDGADELVDEKESGKSRTNSGDSCNKSDLNHDKNNKRNANGRLPSGCNQSGVHSRNDISQAETSTKAHQPDAIREHDAAVSKSDQPMDTSHIECSATQVSSKAAQSVGGVQPQTLSPTSSTHSISSAISHQRRVRYTQKAQAVRQGTQRQNSGAGSSQPEPFQQQLQRFLKKVQRRARKQQREILLAKLVLLCASLFVISWTPYLVGEMSDLCH